MSFLEVGEFVLVERVLQRRILPETRYVQVKLTFAAGHREPLTVSATGIALKLTVPDRCPETKSDRMVVEGMLGHQRKVQARQVYLGDFTIVKTEIGRAVKKLLAGIASPWQNVQIADDMPQRPILLRQRIQNSSRHAFVSVTKSVNHTSEMEIEVTLAALVRESVPFGPTAGTLSFLGGIDYNGQGVLRMKVMPYLSRHLGARLVHEVFAVRTAVNLPQYLVLTGSAVYCPFVRLNQKRSQPMLMAEVFNPRSFLLVAISETEGRSRTPNMQSELTRLTVIQHRFTE